MTEKVHDIFGELYRSKTHERHKPKRSEDLDFERSGAKNVGDIDPTKVGHSRHDASQYADLQAAIDAASTGDTIYVDNTTETPDVTYLDTMVNIIGGPSQVRKTETVTLDTSLKIGNGGEDMYGMHFEGFTVTGGPNTDNGVELVGQNGVRYFNITFHRVHAKGAKNGFRLTDMFNVRLSQCSPYGCELDGIQTDKVGDASLGRVLFDLCQPHNNGRHGFHEVSAGANFIYRMPTTAQNSGKGMKLLGNVNNMVYNSRLEREGTGLAETAGQTYFIGGYWTGANETPEGVRFTGSFGYIDKVRTVDLTGPDVVLDGSVRTRIGLPDQNSGSPALYNVDKTNGYAPVPVGSQHYPAIAQIPDSGDVSGRSITFDATPYWWSEGNNQWQKADGTAL